MCGRFTLTTPSAVLAEAFGLPELPNLTPRYNIAPTQLFSVVRESESRRAMVGLRWGLIPSWAKDPAIGKTLINARGETAASKPSFRAAFRQRRCLVPADGFYEWKRSGKVKQPFYIRRLDGAPFAIAGLWERWRPGEGQALETFALITTAANSVLKPIHDRMPVILEASDYELWLDPGMHDAERLQALIRPAADRGIEAYPVSTRVNNPRNEGTALIERI